MLERRTSPQSIAWFIDLYHGRQLDLSPPYQRLSVWNLSYRQYFIDTILRNYPSPQIFLNVDISSGNRTEYHVVDGKQRLTTIIDFMSDKFSTSTKDSGPALGDKYYSDLEKDTQNKFLRYIIPVEFLEDADQAELENAFDRLNRNVAKLNAQELRNARFSGQFIKLMEGLSDDPFWKDIGLATTSRIRRMLDVEYVSEIFLLTMKGVQEGKSTLDEAYADYDDEIPDIEVHRRKYESCKNVISKLWGKLTTDRYSNLADFYSLWAMILHLGEDVGRLDIARTAEALSEFAEKIRNTPAPEEAQEYLVAATQGSNKASNRQKRADTLKALTVFTDAT